MRILVTRPEHDARRTAKKLEALGHSALCAPLMTVQPTQTPPPSGPFDIILVTSANGAARLDALPGWHGRIVYAVGPRTAKAVLAMGDVADMRIAEGDAVSMIAQITAACDRESRILHVTGIDHKPEPDASLRAGGFDVVTWAAYEAVAAARLPVATASALKAQTLDAALHYSRRSVEVLRRLAEAEGYATAFDALNHFCLSEDVAEPLRRRKTGSIIVASAPSEAALLELLPEK